MKPISLFMEGLLTDINHKTITDIAKEDLANTLLHPENIEIPSYKYAVTNLHIQVKWIERIHMDERGKIL